MELELAEYRSDGRRCVHKAAERCQSHRHSYQGCADDADKQRAGHVLDDKYRGEDNADNAEQSRSACEMSDAHEGGVVGDDDAGVLKADEGYEESDTGSDGSLQRSGDGVHDERTYLRRGHEDEEDAFYEDGGQRELPRIAHRKADGEDEEGVQTHAGGKSERLLGIESHDERTDDCSQCRGCEDGVGVHALRSKVGEDVRVDGEDIRHRKERGYACHYLCLEIVLGRIES